MKFSISNIGWDTNHDFNVAQHLKRTSISGIELAPTKYFKDPSCASLLEVQYLRNHWEKLGFPITSVQSLLFNRIDLQLFGSDDTRKRLKDYLINLGMSTGHLGAGPMVFGSPRNRLKGSLSDAEATEIAVLFFRGLLFGWKSNSSFLVLEANPTIYDCDYITTSADARYFVNQVNNKNLQWHIDFACAEASGEDPAAIVRESDITPSHVHLSEYQLGPLKEDRFEDYLDFLRALTERNYLGIVTLEMRDTGNLYDLYQSIDLMGFIADAI